MSRPTRSRDGVLRMSVHIPFRLSRDDVVNLLCYEGREDVEDGLLDDHLSKAAAEKAIRAGLRHGGAEAYDYWRDHVPDELQDDLEAWADAEVRRLYPEFGGPR